MRTIESVLIALIEVDITDHATRVETGTEPQASILIGALQRHFVAQTAPVAEVGQQTGLFVYTIFPGINTQILTINEIAHDQNIFPSVEIGIFVLHHAGARHRMGARPGPGHVIRIRSALDQPRIGTILHLECKDLHFIKTAVFISVNTGGFWNINKFVVKTCAPDVSIQVFNALNKRRPSTDTGFAIQSKYFLELELLMDLDGQGGHRVQGVADHGLGFGAFLLEDAFPFFALIVHLQGEALDILCRRNDDPEHGGLFQAEFDRLLAGERDRIDALFLIPIQHRVLFGLGRHPRGAGKRLARIGAERDGIDLHVTQQLHGDITAQVLEAQVLVFGDSHHRVGAGTETVCGIGLLRRKGQGQHAVFVNRDRIVRGIDRIDERQLR